VLNVLFNKVAGNANLKNKIKFIGAAQGQDQSAAQMWKKFNKVPFAIVPDQGSKLGKAMNFMPYPVTMLVDKNGKVLWVHVGSFENADEAFSGIKKAIK